MIVRPYQQFDEKRLCFDSSQAYLSEYIKDLDVDLEPLADEGLAWTFEREDGKIAAIGGLMPVWENRAVGWMWMSDVSGKHMITIHRFMDKLAENAPFKRIEATVDIGFAPGARWMKMLGFELEGYLRGYNPNGNDMLMYARVKQ